MISVIWIKMVSVLIQILRNWLKVTSWDASLQKITFQTYRNFVLLLMDLKFDSFYSGSYYLPEAHSNMEWYTRFPREENSNPLQYSCLENSTDWGARRATVHGVVKSQPWLSSWARHTQGYVSVMVTFESHISLQKRLYEVCFRRQHTISICIQSVI